MPEVNQIPVACFAPDITEENLQKYTELIEQVSLSELRNGLDKCLVCVKAWWNLPESTLDAKATFTTLHQGTEKKYSIVPLEDAHIEQLDSVTPWTNECEYLKQLFDKINQTDLRNAAFHLLWHTIEISLDREPVTQAKLG